MVILFKIKGWAPLCFRAGVPNRLVHHFKVMSLFFLNKHLSSLWSWFARLKSLTNIVFNENVEEIARDWPMTPNLQKKMLGQVAVLDSAFALTLDSVHRASCLVFNHLLCLQLNILLRARGRIDFDDLYGCAYCAFNGTLPGRVL